MSTSEIIKELKQSRLDSAKKPDMSNATDAAYVKEFDLVAVKYKGDKPIFLFSELSLASSMEFEGKGYVMMNKSLPIEHVDGVTAHELGHLAAKDTTPGLRPSQINLGVSFLAALTLSCMVLAAYNRVAKRHEQKVEGIDKASMLMSRALAGILLLVSSFSLLHRGGVAVEESISIRRETRADDYASDLVPAQELVEFMEWRIRVTKPNPFQEMLEGKMKKTHPSDEDRLDFFRQKAKEQEAESAEAAR